MSWTLDDIPWSSFDRAKLDPKLIPLIKAAAMVEYNGGDYARYLNEVFHDDPHFQALAAEWAQEEVKHGEALRRWAEMADPIFDFESSFKRFSAKITLPTNINHSVRGSRSGELIARCMVETGTSSYYTALKDYTEEPVLKAICAKIAADEFRHYKLFYTALNAYLEKENLGFWGRLRVALARITESEDDELAYAYFAANRDPSADYQHSRDKHYYIAGAYALYRPHHIDRMVAMAFKAVGLKPHTRLHKLIYWFVWKLISLRAERLKAYGEAII